jgi:hypothetical protein
MLSRSPRRSAEQWSAIIADYQAGTESDTEYCQRLKLNFHTFRKRKYAHTGKSVPAFHEVKVASDSTSHVITVHACDGVRIEMPISMDMNAVAQLVRALQHER